jgi:hypothetical protein
VELLTGGLATLDLLQPVAASAASPPLSQMLSSPTPAALPLLDMAPPNPMQQPMMGMPGQPMMVMQGAGMQQQQQPVMMMMTPQMMVGMQPQQVPVGMAGIQQAPPLMPTPGQMMMQPSGAASSPGANGGNPGMDLGDLFK